MQSKQDREQAFHDAAYSESIRAPVWGFYKIMRSSNATLRQWLSAEHLPGKRVLEIGSGAASQAFFLGSQGAEVTAIDISPVAVEQGRQRAVIEHLDHRVTFRVMDAEHLEFPDDSFHVVCGAGILHHLELPAAYAEIARVLRPGGCGIFLEPLGHNPLINAYRRRTPALRTVDEHPLLTSDLEQARAYFRRVDTRFFHLSSLAAIPFRDRSVFLPLLSALDELDRGLFRRLPFLRKHAWMSVSRLADPIHANGPVATGTPDDSFRLTVGR